MSKLEWQETYSIGIEAIDQQHRKWIDIINSLHDSLIKGEKVSEITLEILDEMIDYCNYHFSFEEEYMERIGYPGFGVHKRIHGDFLNDLRQYRADEKSGNFVLNTRLMKTLMNWLTDHIMTEDKKIQSFQYTARA